MPLVRALGEAGNPSARLHMPGHKGGKGLAGLGYDALNWDVTELFYSDDLFAPTGCIQAANRLAASCFGAAHSTLLTGGSTSGLLALLLALPPQGKVVVGRDCHKSVAAGLCLGGQIALPAWPRWGKDGQLGCIVPEDVEDIFKKYGDVCAVVVTYPNYYGMCADIRGIAQVAHAHGAALLLDGAHGTHFACRLPEYPAHASVYADGWVDGAHKTLAALGQGAFLHLGARAAHYGLTWERVMGALSLVHTSSPSYAVMASLDAARHRLQRGGAEWRTLAKACATFREAVAALPGLHCPDIAGARAVGAVALDPARLVVDVRGRGLTGYAAQSILNSAGVAVELADDRRIVALPAPWDLSALDLLYDALEKLPYLQMQAPISPPWPPPVAPWACSDALRAPQEWLPLCQAVGRVCAGLVGLYPPGIPVLWPGERVEADIAAYLTDCASMGARLFGTQEGRLPVMAVGTP